MTPPSARPHTRDPGELVVAWHQGLSAGTWRQVVLDGAVLAVQSPTPLLDPAQPVALRVRLGDSAPLCLWAQVTEAGSGSTGPRLALLDLDPAQQAVLQSLESSASEWNGPLLRLEAELAAVLAQEQAAARGPMGPSRSQHLMWALTSLLAGVGVATLSALLLR